MKLRLLTPLILFSFTSPPVYFVSHVNGRILHYPARTPLRTGERISNKDSLLFVSPDAWASVISPETGRFIVQRRKPMQTAKAPGWVLAVSENLEPTLTTATMAGRAGLVNRLEEIPLFLHTETGKESARLLLADSIWIPLNASAFSPKGHFFYIKCRYQGGSINKRLRFRRQDASTVLLIIDRSLYKVDEKPVLPEEFSKMELYYYDEAKQDSWLVTPLVINTPSREALRTEIGVLKNNLSLLYQKQPDKESAISAALFDELFRSYGFINPESVKSY